MTKSREERLQEALEWLVEMTGHAIKHIDPEWARANGADLQNALDTAKAVEAPAAELHALDVDDDELLVLIEFQEQMARDAVDSGEFEEAVNRRQRATDLKNLLARVTA